jgi:hypothetical protein
MHAAVPDARVHRVGSGTTCEHSDGNDSYLYFILITFFAI